MNLIKNTYHGVTAKNIKTENFTLSLTEHVANSKIIKHVHEKPYLCMLVAGMYREDGVGSQIIKNGTSIFREANYEHANHFSNKEGVCLNLEIDNINFFHEINDFKDRLSGFEQKSSLEMFKLLYAFKKGVAKDLLNIYCYESILSHFKEIKIKGKLKWIQKTIEYINDNPFNNISLTELSKEFQLHPNYIVRQFKKYTGLKLSEYISKIRLENALNNMLTTNNSLTEVALKSGFYDQSHFNKHFKKVFNETPKPFQKIMRG